MIFADNHWNVEYVTPKGHKVSGSCAGTGQVKDFVRYLHAASKCIGKPHIKKVPK